MASKTEQGAEINRISVKRSGFVYRSCSLWLRENKPDIYAAIRKEAERRWPFRESTKGAKTTVDYTFLKKLDERKANASR